jgi:co-chaperonin GroES (HSP10)
MRMDRGVRLGNETLTTVRADERIRPLRDQIVVEPLDWEPSKIISVAYWGKPLRGIVRAVGPGTYPKKYDGRKGQRTKMWDAKHFRPCDVKVGDIVELGGLEIGGYLHSTFWWGSIEMVLCREEDVAIVCEQEQAA